MQQRDSQTTKEEAYRHHRLQGQDGRTVDTQTDIENSQASRQISFRQYAILMNTQQCKAGRPIVVEHSGVV